MRLHFDQLGTRVAGTLLGAGFLSIGLYAMFGADESVPAFARERAFWFGVCATLAGVGAILVSLTVKRLDNIWCAPPRKGYFRATGDAKKGLARHE